MINCDSSEIDTHKQININSGISNKKSNKNSGIFEKSNKNKLIQNNIQTRLNRKKYKKLNCSKSKRPNICKSFVNHLNISYLNITSIRNKLSDLENHINSLDNKPHIFVIGETWIKTDEAKFYNIPNYDVIFCNREKQIGGVVCMFINNNLNYEIILSEVIVT